MSSLRARNYQRGQQGTLGSIRVLDLSRLFAGNVLTQILGDFGVEVIKIEPPEGDTLRAWKTAGVETHWKIYSRNKKSLCVSLRDPRAIEIIRNLVSMAHSFTFKEDPMERASIEPAINSYWPRSMPNSTGDSHHQGDRSLRRE